MTWNQVRLEKLLAALGGAGVGMLFSGVWLLWWLGWSWILALPPAVGAVIGYIARDRGIRALVRGTTLR